MTLGSYRAAPIIGHLDIEKRLYSYLRNYKKTLIKFRTEIPNYEMYEIESTTWYCVYHPCSDHIPTDAPEPRGKSVLTTTFKDSNLLFDYMTGRSVTGIIHMMNNTPIDWFCKKQNTIETYTYGSEFTASRIAVEQIIYLRYTLRILGITFMGPSVILGDNKSVVDSEMIPSYRLKKRHNIFDFHRVREAVDAVIILMYHLASSENPSDVLTKHRSIIEWYSLMIPLLAWACRDEIEK